MAESSDLTPIEWLDRLGCRLLERRPRVDKWRAYFDGEQDLPQGPAQDRQAFQEFQRTARTNLCLLCAESMVHRTQVQGFRATTGTGGASEQVWKLWQAAKLDARQFGIWRKAYSRSAAYVTVGVDPRRPRTPRVTIEGPENVIVECDPADASTRLAALRLWHDPIVKRWFATLYLPGPTPDRPGLRYHWVTRREHKTDQSRSMLKFSDQGWELRDEPGRSLPAVPVVPFHNGDEGEEPRSEFDVGIDVQNRLNLTVLTRLTAERYGAFRQRGLLNFEPETDPVTGVTIAPFPPGVHQLWTVPPPDPGDPEPKLFDFQQTDTLGILRGIEADMRAFAAITITPVYYLPGDLVNISADSVAALDAGHINKVRQRHTVFGEGIEETLQLMADVAELELDLTTSEAVWMRPENFNPASVADFMSKLRAAGVPLPMVVEEGGWSPQRVEALRSELAAEELRSMLLTQPTAAPAFGQPAPSGPPRPPSSTPQPATA
jgi:hypothetical protein